MRRLTSGLFVLLLAFGIAACDDDSSSNNTSNINNTTNTNNASCGDGVVDGTDECDDLDLDGQTCADQGFTGGVLACNADCTFNVDACTDTCADECTADETLCTDDVLSTCVVDSETGCTVWEDTDCSGLGQVCDATGAAAECVDTCTDACTEDETQCNGSVIELCAIQTSGCTDWETSSDCADNSELCDDTTGIAECVPDCTPECTAGESRCTGSAVEECTDPDSNGCTIWAASGVDCTGPSEECQVVTGTAQCVLTCSAECTLGDTRCSIDTIQLCDDPDSNGCFVWTDEADCAAISQVCDMGSGTASCVAPPAGENCADVLPLTVPVDISGDSFSADFPGDDFSVDPGTCDSADGPDAVFVVNLTAGATYIITEHDALDAVLHVQDVCDETGICLASADDGLSDSLLFAPEVDGDYYIVLEAWSSTATNWDQPYHLTIVEMESAEATCDDGVDNDGDGVIDCFDPDCAGIASCGPEDTDVFCGDGIDNDGDGVTDCEDSDCAGVGPCGPENTAARCADGIDNDNDGFTDCDDSDCFGMVGACESETNCADGEDNDGDGFTDCADPDCSGVGTCGPEDTAAACDDGYDNDGDGSIDCDDPDCSTVLICMPKRGIYEQFTTSGAGNANDLDGFRIVFTPDGAGDYTYTVSPNATYFVTPGSTTAVESVIAADDTVYPTFTLPFTFNFYGQDYTEVWADSNGYLAFTALATYDMSESVNDLFNSPKIAVAWDDLKPISAGDQLYADADFDSATGRDFWAFTYTVAEYGTTGILDAQVVLFDDGEIRIDFVTNTITDAITGISMPGLDPIPSAVEFVRAGPGAVIVTEIMADSAMSTEPEGEYFELYNTTGSEIDLTGCEVHDNSGTYIIADVTIPANGYVVFENKTAAGTGGLIPTAEPLTVVSLANSGDLLRLVCDGIDIDMVTYTSSLVSTGISMQLNPSAYDGTANDDAANWCLTEAAAAYSFTDGTTIHYGTPGADNNPCPMEVLFEESFTTFIPLDWSTYTYDATDTNVLWTQCDSCGETLSGSDGIFAMIDTNGSGLHADSYLETMAVDLTGRTGIQLSFLHYYRHFSGSSARVEYSIDGGTTWVTIASWSASSTDGALETYPLPALAGQADVRFRFYYYGDNDYYWYLDDVKLEANF